MAGLFFEQFFVGQTFEHPWSRTVTEMDNVMYCALTMNVAPIHLDEHYCAGTEFGQRMVASLYTAGLMIGQTINETTFGTTVANLGMSDMRFPKPVFHGDTIRTTTRVVSKRESKSRPDAGIVEFEHIALNQRDEQVAVCRRNALMKKRAAKPAGA
jgi:acyl dehydratase